MISITSCKVQILYASSCVNSSLQLSISAVKPYGRKAILSFHHRTKHVSPPLSLTYAWQDANQGRSSSLWLLFSVLLTKPIQAEHYEVIFTHSISAKPQKQPKNRPLSPLLTNFWEKNHRRIIASNFKVFLYFFALIFFTLTLATIFV